MNETGKEFVHSTTSGEITEIQTMNETQENINETIGEGKNEKPAETTSQTEGGITNATQEYIITTQATEGNKTEETKNQKEDYREIPPEASDEEGLVNSYTQLLKQASQLVDNIQAFMDKEQSGLPDIPEPILRGKFFDMSKFNKIYPEIVQSLPHDINGTKMYIIDCSGLDENDWQKKYKDGRYFRLNTSKRKGFRGLRRIGKCLGNYQSTNKECPIFQSTGKANKHQFKKLEETNFVLAVMTYVFNKMMCYKMH